MEQMRSILFGLLAGFSRGILFSLLFGIQPGIQLKTQPKVLNRSICYHLLTAM
jgi:hypothetical protein